MLRTNAFKAAAALLLGAAISGAALGCGPSAEQLALRDQCLNNCGADSMTCLEESRCVDIDGHSVPCEEECDDERAACESGC